MYKKKINKTNLKNKSFNNYGRMHISKVKIQNNRFYKIITGLAKMLVIKKI